MVIGFLAIAAALILFGVQWKYRELKKGPFIRDMSLILLGFGAAFCVTDWLTHDELAMTAVCLVGFGAALAYLGAYGVLNIFRCSLCVKAVYTGCVTRYVKGRKLYGLDFEYVVQGQRYKERSEAREEGMVLDAGMRRGRMYDIYVWPKYPRIFLVEKKVRADDILLLLLGAGFCIFGCIVLLVG